MAKRTLVILAGVGLLILILVILGVILLFKPATAIELGTTPNTTETPTLTIPALAGFTKQPAATTPSSSFSNGTTFTQNQKTGCTVQLYTG